MRAPSLILVAAIAASLPSFAHAQVRVTQIVSADGATLDSTDDVALYLFGSVEPTVVKLNTELEIGSELRARSGSTAVVLACPETGEITLAQQFRVVIAPRPEGKTCYVDLLAGPAYVMGDSTGLGAGDVTAGAKATHYRMTVSRSGDSLWSDLDVFDGEVEVRPTSHSEPVVVSAGSTLAVVHGQYARGRVGDRRIRVAAELYGRIDASRAAPGVRREATDSLSAAYRQVFAQPRSATARINLIARQIQFGAARKATLYHIDRLRQIEGASALAPPTDKLQATTTALSVAVYTQLGDEQQASAQYKLLQSYNQQRLNGALRSYKIDPKIVRRAGQFEARAHPHVPEGIVHPLAVPHDSLRLSVHGARALVPGQARVRIVVTVQDQAGTAVAGATVRLSAGRGFFAGGDTHAQGVTGPDGTFRIVWSCSQCPTSNAFSVEVAKNGFVPARTTLSVPSNQ